MFSLLKYSNVNGGVLSDYGMQLAIMGDGGVRRQNRGFHWRAIAVGEDSKERDLNDVSEIQLNFVVSQGVEESVERLLQPGFEVSDDADDLVDGLLVQHTARSIDEQMDIFVKLNVWSQFHRLPDRYTKQQQERGIFALKSTSLR